MERAIFPLLHGGATPPPPRRSHSPSPHSPTPSAFIRISGSGYPEIRGNPDIRISGYPDFEKSGYPENPDIQKKRIESQSRGSMREVPCAPIASAWSPSCGRTGTCTRIGHRRLEENAMRCYVADVSWFRENRKFWAENVTTACVMPMTRSIDVDTEDDFQMADFFINMHS